MAGASLLTLLDDIATVLDDVALMTKVAAKKTAGVLGDDLALNAEQVSGVNADRELPVVWAVAVGSLKNKGILIPVALTLSAAAHWAIMPLLMVGGAYLSYEGFEKLAHSIGHAMHLDSAQQTVAEQAQHAALIEALAHPEVDIVAFEKDKIQGAIRTDFVLSGEIIIISLGTVATASFMTQFAVLCGIGAIMTVGVYGFVALIVKLDDMGLYLKRQTNLCWYHGLRQGLGNSLLSFAPRLMKALTVIGTIAMFLVGGGILIHGIPAASDLVHHLTAEISHAAANKSAIGSVVETLVPTVIDAVAGVLAGGLVFLGMKLVERIKQLVKK